MAVNRGNGGILGTGNAPQAELITAFPASGTFTARSSTSAVDLLVVAGGGGGGSGGQNQSQYGRISDTGGDGGSGIVIMYEPAANSGVWNMDDVFRYVSDGKW